MGAGGEGVNVSFSVIPTPFSVIPAKAGIQAASLPGTTFVWIPAFAGMTGEHGEVRA
jgi:hypothetical protein